MKVILVAILMHAQSGEISEVREPRGYATEAQCREAASLLSSAKPGYVVRAYCLIPSQIQ